MIYVLTPDEMRAADAAAAERVGSISLMRDAGVRLAQYVRETLPAAGRIVAFAGPGNNGGDAFAAFAELDSSYERIIYSASTQKPPEARADAEERARAAGVVVRPFPETDAAAHEALDGASMAFDALFGTGSRLPMPEMFRAAARALDGRRLPVIAVDIPSGIDALTGAVTPDAVRASVTITIAAAKPGLLLDPAQDHVGELLLATIGIDDATLAAHAKTFGAFDDAAFLAQIPKRGPDVDKRGSGAPLIIAGSEQFPGAAVLCARGAARAGAGYVTVATPAAAAPALRMHLVEQVVVFIHDDRSADEVVDDLIDIAQRNTSIGIGPGLGLDDRTGEIVRGLVARAELPIVADASALFHFAKNLDILRGKRLVITPHAGEFARISGRGTIKEGERVSRLREFVTRTGITTLLKGRDTLVDDGRMTYINTTGTNALATAGTGDVLTGIIATLLSQGLSPADAARTGAYWHGLAGRYCAQHRRVGVMSGDLPDALADALPSVPIRPTHLRRIAEP